MYYVISLAMTSCSVKCGLSIESFVMFLGFATISPPLMYSGENHGSFSSELPNGWSYACCTLTPGS